MANFGNIERPVFLPLTPFYGIAVFFRNLFFDLGLLRSVKFKIPVISVGNITAGGTGKTPHTEFLVSLLRNEYRVAVLSRGYKRRTNDFMIVKKKNRVSDAGDEPLQIRRKFPDVVVAVHNRRAEGIRLLGKAAKKPDIIILDDGFQHRYVKPGLSLLLIDYNRPLFRDILLPAGNLREPAGNLKRADILIVTKCPAGLSSSDRGSFIARLKPSGRQDIFFTRYEYGPLTAVFRDKHKESDILSQRELKKTGVSFMLVTGIANPRQLREYLTGIAPIDEEIIFPDHHFFTAKDMELIGEKFDNLNASEKYIIVTEKDAVRLQEAEIRDKRLRKSIYYIPVEVKFLAKGEKPFIKRIFKYLKKAR